MFGPTLLSGSKAIQVAPGKKPPEINESIWEVVKKRGFVDLYVLQPGDPENPSDPNHAEALRPEVKVVKDIDKCLEYVTEQCVGGKLIRRMRFGSHGNSTSFKIGWTYVSVNELKCNPELRKKVLSLKDHFLPGFTKVTLDACYCGQGKELLIYMAGIWGVPVLSYIEAQGTEPLDEPTKGTGPARECHPDAQCYYADDDAGEFTLDTEKIWHTKPRCE
jgi:hypothetical protein